MGEHATVIPQVGQRCRMPGRRLVSHRHHVEPGADQRADGDDLDHGEPELHFAEHLHRHQVQAEQQADTRQRRYPQGDVGEPELRIGRDGDHVGDTGDNPAEPVGPAGEEPRPRAEQVSREIDERLVLQVGQQQFAHCPHDKEQHEADDHVDKDDGGPRQADGLARAHEQAGADSTANGDQLDMAVGQVTLEFVCVTIRRAVTVGQVIHCFLPC
ncbi:hypothetical protein D3C81_691010 [compost metagenome]